MDSRRDLKIEILQAQLVHLRSYRLFLRRLFVQIISGDAVYSTPFVRAKNGMFSWNQVFLLPKVIVDELITIRVMNKGLIQTKCIGEAVIAVDAKGAISKLVLGALPIVSKRSKIHKGTLTLKAEWDSPICAPEDSKLSINESVLEMSKNIGLLMKKYDGQTSQQRKNLKSLLSFENPMTKDMKLLS